MLKFRLRFIEHRKGFESHCVHSKVLVRWHAALTVQHSRRFGGDSASIKLTVEMAVISREDAMRAAAGEVARIFPACNDEIYGEPRPRAPVDQEQTHW